MKRLSQFLSAAAGRQDIILIVMLMVAIFMMILPLPTELVDLLIAVNLTFSIILLMIAVYIREPLEFSVFPSVLLITTLFRLSLTISTSRLILLQHDAGEIVYTFGNFVVGGNMVVGMIIFAIITIVQFIVITKGSERVAEVGARFSLDGMPGKQMSIDGDMRAGIIDAAEAKRQRTLVQKESQLYGAMDGAMKFVKGDAIAGMIVILVNILGGITVGVMQHGMSASEAASTYSILSVGDGLIAQIPALLISITAGIIVTRVPGEEKQNLAKDLTSQIGHQPQALLIAVGVLMIFAVIPGFPFLVFLALAGLLLGAALFLMKRNKTQAAGGQSGSAAGEESGKGAITPGAVPLMLKMSAQLAKEGDLLTAVDELRWQKFERLGVPLPEIILQQDANLSGRSMSVFLYQEPVLTVQMPDNQALVEGSAESFVNAVEQPLPFGGPRLCWVDIAQGESISALGTTIFKGTEQTITLLSRVLDRFAGEFIGVQECRFLMDGMEGKYSELVKELQRQLPIGKIAEILQRLVAEGISIRDLRSIFEALLEWSQKEKDVVLLTEYVRVGLRRHIVGRHQKNAAWIYCHLIGDGIENMIRESIRQTSAGGYSALSPQQNELILEQIKQHTLNSEVETVLLTAIDVRRYLRKIIEKDLYTLPVLSFQELGEEVELKVQGSIDLIGEELSDAVA
ncbi:EscV/YscV/HrcV family type III secretion system export apparatus protein [Vibrio sp. S4M6]|uniref:EscV/YscV/HrcV family type III secretion system export apparatus protein n=1 Tax=Vibrio sinus TaxID=2946865 RepID=UPI002029DD4D|nr:EscV/YscV/HrcV family type III secretion system export apparatus protein [Vibrio sinus]MCL9783819.1 EscV/YscV/HrcV family type III secretion system export apparatus protein [Vibrio sinus]